MKIIYSWGHSDSTIKPFIEEEIKEWINAGYNISEVRDREELGVTAPWSPQELDRRYQSKDNKLLRLYDKVERMAENHDIFITNHGNVYHPEFVKSLKHMNIYTVICSGDDPEASNYCSKPYVHAFDHSFAWAVNFNSDTKMTDKFLQWGAKRADYWPYGVWTKAYDTSLTEQDILNKKRDIDLVYVGYPSTKLARLVKLKQAFPQMVLYGHGWNLKTCLGSPISYRMRYGSWNREAFLSSFKAVFLGLWRVKELPIADLVPLYQRCKIGINMHLSFGPSNLRTFQLPANGMLQICDCPEGLGQVYQIGKEITVYHSVGEAIELIRYYLEHDNERKEIAIAGFRRTVIDYKRLTTFAKAVEKIKRGMLQDGIMFFKDGSPIRCNES